MSRRSDILGKLRTIPRLPVAAVDCLRMLQDPEVAVEAIVPKIAHDPGLTAALLRVANSAAFAGYGECTTLRNALVRLGNERVRQVLVRAGLGPGGSRAIDGYGLAAGELLEHSMLVARGVVTLSKLLHVEPPAEAFTAGLLHNVGKLVMGTYLEVDGTAISHLAHAEHLSFDEAERMVLGIDHAEVGAELLKCWELPESIIAAVRWHHLPEHCSQPRLAAQLIHLSDSSVIREGVGAGVDGEFYPPSSETVETLRFTPTIAEELAKDLRSDRRRLGKMFGFETKPSLVTETAIPEGMDEEPVETARGPLAMQRLLGFMFQKR